jgi:josephin
MSDEKESPRLYHEKQSSQLCAIHTCNNIVRLSFHLLGFLCSNFAPSRFILDFQLQRPRFTKENFDEICLNFDSSTIFNEHRSVWGTGNYGIFLDHVDDVLRT